MIMHEFPARGSDTSDEIRRVTREHRRKTGMYYTPVSTAQYITRKAAEKWLQLARQGQTSVRILDPACGDGIFLVESIRQFRGLAPRGLPGGVFEPRVYGIDIDGVALHSAWLSTILSMSDVEIEIDDRNVHLFKHDALESDLFPAIKVQGGFDLIVGNPPYIPWNRVPREARKAFESGRFLDASYPCRPNHEDAQPNYYLFFIVLASNLLSERGVISFLLPQEWLYHERALEFRSYLLERFKTIDVGLFPPDAKIFTQKGMSAGTTSMILTLSKHGDGGVTIHGVDEAFETRTSWARNSIPSGRPIHISNESALAEAWSLVDPEARAIKDSILSQAVAPFDDPAEFAVHGGFQPPVEVARRYELEESDYARLSSIERDFTFRLVLDAREIKRYAIVDSIPRYWIVTNGIPSELELAASCPTLHAILRSRLDTGRPGWWRFPNVRNLEVVATTREKILAPRTASKPCFALDDRRSVFKGTNTMIIPKRLSARYVIGILNSKLAAFWQDTFGFGYHGGLVKKLEPSKARKSLMPVKHAPKRAQEALMKLVGEMIELVKQDTSRAAIDALQGSIDAAVYELYDVRGRMRDLVEARVAMYAG